MRQKGPGQPILQSSLKRLGSLLTLLQYNDSMKRVHGREGDAS